MMTLFLRYLIGAPMFVMLGALFLITFFRLTLPIVFGDFPDESEFAQLLLAPFFAMLAYAIWRILLFRPAASVYAFHSADSGSTGNGSDGGDILSPPSDGIPPPPPPDDIPPSPPAAGKPAPLIPRPTHHLAAAKELPPSEKTQSYPHDLRES